MSNIIFKNITKSYESEYGLIDFDCEIKSGEFVTVVGSSGAGKSTFLKLIAGLLKPDCGELYIGDELVNDVVASKRDVAMMFQELVLYPNYNVYENVAAYLKFNHIESDTVRNKVYGALKLFGLETLANRRIKELSGGQQQRVALAKVFVRNPKVILFDEPLSNIDEENKQKYKKNIIQLKELLPNTTFLYVTHNVSEALTLGERVLLLENGRNVGFDRPINLINYPPTITYLEIFNNIRIEQFHNNLELLEDFYLDTIKEKNEITYVVKNINSNIAFDQNGNLLGGVRTYISFTGKLNNGLIHFKNFMIKLNENLKTRLLIQDVDVNVRIDISKLRKEHHPKDLEFECRFLEEIGVYNKVLINNEVFLVNKDLELNNKMYCFIDDIELFSLDGSKVLTNYVIYPNKLNVIQKQNYYLINKDKISTKYPVLNNQITLDMHSVKCLSKKGFNKIRVNILSEEIIDDDFKLVYAYVLNAEHYITFYLNKHTVINYKKKNYIDLN